MAVDPMGHTRKFTRALEHLASIEELVLEWNKLTTYETISEPDPEHSQLMDCQRYVAKIGGPPLPELSALLGDCLHNFRSVLDHLIWYASVLHSGDNPPHPRRIQFPAYADATLYTSQGLHAVSQDVKDTVETLQPYHARSGAHDHPLWVLCELNNYDKHRELNAVDHVARSPTFGVTSQYPGPWMEAINDGPITDGTVIARLFTPPSMAENDVVVRLALEHGVAILETETTPELHLGKTLIGIRNSVAETAKAIVGVLA